MEENLEREAQIKEVARNSEAFDVMLPDLLAQNLEGQYALMRDEKIELILKDFHDAVIIGNKLFEDKRFSVEHITDEAINLGHYSYF